MKTQSIKKSFTGETVALIDLCTAISDCPHYTPNWTDEGKLVIRNFNIKHGRLDLTEKFFTDEYTFNDRIKRHKPESGDLIITREAPMGEVCIIPDNVECCLGQRTVLIKPNRKKVNNRFLLYSIISDFVQHQIKKSDGSGSIVSNLCIPDLEQLQIPIVEFDEQSRIANVLSSIDKKIELNIKINSELEAMAKTIYNYWFVQYDFPNEDCKPYKASGGEMEWNAELKREIPKGWEIRSISDTALKLNSGGTPNTLIKDYYDGEIPWYSTQELQDCFLNGSIKTISKKAINESSAKLFPKDTVVIAIYAAPTVGRLGILSSEATFNQACCGIVADENQISREFLHLYLKRSRSYLNQIASGTAQKNLNVEKIKTMQILVPSKDVNESFRKNLKPIFGQIEINQKQNQELISLRNFLLPLLMNGQVKVK